MPKWTFLTNHALVLSFLARHPRITAVELAQAIGIRERAIRKIIADLQADGYIRKKREGRGNTYTINLDLPLRSETHRHVAIGNLLETLAWERIAENHQPAKPGVRRLKERKLPGGHRASSRDGRVSKSPPDKAG